MEANVLDVALKLLGAIGGVGVMVIGLSYWLGGVWRDRLKERERRETERLLERDRNQLAGARVLADQHSNAQYTLYRDLWRTLQDLKDAGTSLWEDADINNLERFVWQLRLTAATVDRGAIFFHDEDLRKLRALLEAFDQFRIGKVTLRAIRSRQDLVDTVEEDEVRRQIQQNAAIRASYEELLERLRMVFSQRLTGRH